MLATGDVAFYARAQLCNGHWPFAEKHILSIELKKLFQMGIAIITSREFVQHNGRLFNLGQKLADISA